MTDSFNLKNIIAPLKEIGEYEKLMKWATTGKGIVLAHGLSDTLKGVFLAGLAEEQQRPVIFITHNEIVAKKIYEDVQSIMPEGAVLLPPGDLVFHRLLARSGETRLARLRAIERLAEGGPLVLCASVESVMSPLSPPSVFEETFPPAFDKASGKARLKIGLVYEPGKLAKDLVNAGFERAAIVESRGQFSIRGGIIDLFSPTQDLPARIEFFDDEIDSIRYFDPDTQRSIETIDEITLYPARELLFSEEEIELIGLNLREDLQDLIVKLGKKKNQGMMLKENLDEDIEKLLQGSLVDGIERYINYHKGPLAHIFDFSPDATIVIDESDRVKERCNAMGMELRENMKSLLENYKVLPGQVVRGYDFEWLRSHTVDKKLLLMSALLKGVQEFKPNDMYGFTCRSMHPYHGRIGLVVEEISGWKGRDYRVVVLSGGEERGKRLAEALRENDIPAIYMDNFDNPPVPGQVLVIPGTLNGGFEFPTLKYAVISDREVYAPASKKKTRKGGIIKAFTDLKVGDYVVHDSHGVGQYLGIEKIKIGNITKDYLHIRYKGTDKIYIPTDQMDLIQRFIGNGETEPKLNKIGSAEWHKAKAKAKGAVEEMARELMELYALRQQLSGFQFPEDTKWQREFEDAFPYEETGDQLKCVEEIKEDMESGRVMDRLLCGDVGFGKTEVALRAIFKCVTAGKQAAILVPTTILAQQHFNTCLKRFSSYPVNIGQLSRFRTDKEIKETLDGLQKGSVDLVIGTHRLLSEDIKFRDLGLLVVDEEQRFGVLHKERIKTMRKDIDVITLSATPIPRTLHMSMIGVRDISIIQEPPEERYPVQTYVMEYDNEIVREAIIREISRGGQVYFLHNRVSNISQTTAKLAALVPEAKFAYAHGKMNEHQLEDTMIGYYHGDFDVLVCTTIIETGLDIPNVNTIIIADADRMGLSQLYQLRGRVGRSNRVAYAYLTYQRDKVLSETSEKRLIAIKEFTELGSGFKIAMRDLELRGTGNLLGTSQSGHMEAIGYELYIKMLDETVKTLKGEQNSLETDTQVDISIEAHIPDHYISESAQKIDVYRKISFIETRDEISELTDELIDRFGDVPTAVMNLFAVSFIRNNCRHGGVTHISLKNTTISVKFKPGAITPERAIQYASDYKGRLLFSAGEIPYFTIRITPEEALKPLNMLMDLAEKLRSSK